MTTCETAEKQLAALEPLQQKLLKSKSAKERYSVLKNDSNLNKLFTKLPAVKLFFDQSSVEVQAAIAAVAVLGQGEVVFDHVDKIDHASDRLNELSKTLVEVDSFYNTLGGIVGYHCTVLRLVVESQQHMHKDFVPTHYLKPEGLDLRLDNPQVRQAIRYGIEKMDALSEIYPVGGAGDRLDLKHDDTKEDLPAAALNFKGRSLLEGLIRDLQGREFLHYKLTGEQVVVPVAMMTSHEKNNQQHINQIFDRNHWFGREKESYFFFVQPLVPVITEQGCWAMEAPLKIKLKPGGHGVIWKLAEDKGVFRWLEDKKKTKALVRQINNPAAGVDHGLVSFSGVGFLSNKDFGFASCPRLLNTAEGVDILVETERYNQFRYRLTNIEYTQFAERGILDSPAEAGGKFSMYPANTNILFADLKVIKETLVDCPIPGMMINMKGTVSVLDHEGHLQKVKAGRLESMMQNVADQIETVFDHKIASKDYDKLRSYLTYNERRKTISVTKNSYSPDKSLVETPEGCFYEMMINDHALLSENCAMKVPSIPDEQTFLGNGPSSILDFHPALGPLWTVIGQKIRGGELSDNSELRLEISELDMSNVKVEGSLLIEAENVMGSKKDRLIVYNDDGGKCRLENVVIENAGIDRQAKNIYWKNKISRKESCRIVIKGNGEFVAKDVTIRGDLLVEVPAGHRVTAYEEKGKVGFKTEKIDGPSWWWEYSFDENDVIKLRVSEKN